MADRPTVGVLESRWWSGSDIGTVHELQFVLLLKPTTGYLVTDLGEQRLCAWLTAAQREELDCVLVEIDLAAHKPVRRMRIGVEAVAEEADHSMLGGATKINQASRGKGLEVELPVGGKVSTCRCAVEASCVTLTMRLDVARRSLDQLGDGSVMVTSPNIFLPSTVEGLDGGLKPRLTWRDEDRRDAKAQTRPHDAANDITVLVSTLKTRVVVELYKVGKTHRLPMLHQSVQHPPGARLGLDRPGLGQPSMQRNRRQYRHKRPFLDAQILNQIKTIDFGPPINDRRQVPPHSRCWKAAPRPSIQHAAPLKDTPDCSHAGQPSQLSSLQGSMNCHIAVLAEGAVLLEFLASLQDEFLDLRRDSVGGPSSLAILKVNSIQSLLRGPCKPVLHLSQTDPEVRRNRALGHALTNGANHFPSPLLFRGFCSSLSYSFSSHYAAPASNDLPPARSMAICAARQETAPAAPRSSPHAGGGGVPRGSLPAPPRPIPKGPHPTPLAQSVSMWRTAPHNPMQTNSLLALTHLRWQSGDSRTLTVGLLAFRTTWISPRSGPPSATPRSMRSRPSRF